MGMAPPRLFEGQAVRPWLHLLRSVIRAAALYEPLEQHRNCLIEVDMQVCLVEHACGWVFWS